MAAMLPDEAAPPHAGSGALLFPQFCEALVRIAVLEGGPRGMSTCLVKQRQACLHETGQPWGAGTNCCSADPHRLRGRLCPMHTKCAC